MLFIRLFGPKDGEAQGSGPHDDDTVADEFSRSFDEHGDSERSSLTEDEGSSNHEDDLLDDAGTGFRFIG